MCDRIDDIMMGKVVLENPALFQLCPSAEDLPQYAEHGSAQTKIWKGPTLRYRKVQDLEQDPLYLEDMGLPIFRDQHSPERHALDSRRAYGRKTEKSAMFTPACCHLSTRSFSRMGTSLDLR